MHSGADHGHDDDGHNDRDVDFSASLLAAKHTHGGDNQDLGLLTAYVVVLLLPVERTVEPFAALDLPEPTSVFTLRPPVRGPPL